MERGDPRVGDLVASVAGMVGERLAGVTGDIQHVIEQAIPTLQDDGFAPLLGASIGENIDVALQILTGTAAAGSGRGAGRGGRLRPSASPSRTYPPRP